MATMAIDDLRSENARLKQRVLDLEAELLAQAAPFEDPASGEEAARSVRAMEAKVESLNHQLGCGEMSASSAALALAENVSVEYTRDSPMFRRAAEAYESSVEGLDELLRELCDRLRTWTAAQAEADEAAKRVSAWLRDRRHSRALFSSAHAALPEATVACRRMSEELDELIRNRSELAYAVSSMTGRLSKFRVHEVGNVTEFRAQVWRLGEVYEARLAETLRLDAGDVSEESVAKLEEARARFETARFALVRHLNAIDAKKRLIMAEACSELTDGAIDVYYRRGLHRCEASTERRGLTLRAIAVAKDRAEIDERLWQVILDRLEAELHGELPPPGAPGKARAEGPPARLLAAESKALPQLTAGTPTWSAALNTEVLSHSSLSASKFDLAHVRDEGILKQGYLHRRDVDGLSGLFDTMAGRSRRRWHRLHNGALFIVEDANERRLCDLRGCDVHRGYHKARDSTSGGVLAGSFAFAIIRPDGHKLAFQAENEDELIKWISALRRSTRWRELGGKPRTLPDRAPPQRSNNVDDLAKFALDTRNSKLVAQLALANPRCAECGDKDPEWVATAVGVVVCADCAALHRKLGAGFAKLRALWLDKWSPLMLTYLTRSAGNDIANSIWEPSPPGGWLKPKPTDAIHIKEEWIVAKYAWYDTASERRDIWQVRLHRRRRGFEDSNYPRFQCGHRHRRRIT